jgi:hypothetical protein
MGSPVSGSNGTSSPASGFFLFLLLVALLFGAAFFLGAAVAFFFAAAGLVESALELIEGLELTEGLLLVLTSSSSTSLSPVRSRYTCFKYLSRSRNMCSLLCACTTSCSLLYSALRSGSSMESMSSLLRPYLYTACYISGSEMYAAAALTSLCSLRSSCCARQSSGFLSKESKKTTTASNIYNGARVYTVVKGYCQY